MYLGFPLRHPFLPPALVLLIAAGAPAMAMTPFSGHLGVPPAEAPAPFNTIHALRWVEDPAPYMQFCPKAWLVGDDQGLKVVNEAGSVGWVAPVQGPVTALATRSPDGDPENPWHLVYAHRSPAGAGTVRCVIIDKSTHILAGVEAPGEVTFRDGPAAQAVFGPITALEMAGDGRIYVADAGNRVLREIGLDGQVTTLAGTVAASASAPAPTAVRDGQGGAATFGAGIQGLALDHATGYLYVSDGHCLRRVGTRGGTRGQVETVLGHWATPGFERKEGGVHIPLADEPCLNLPQGLQVHGGWLYLADSGNGAARRFHPVTRELETLAGEPSRPESADGPLARPRVIALNRQGSVKVGLDFGLVGLVGLELQGLGGEPGSLDAKAPGQGASRSSSSSSSLAPPVALSGSPGVDGRKLQYWLDHYATHPEETEFRQLLAQLPAESLHALCDVRKEILKSRELCRGLLAKIHFKRAQFHILALDAQASTGALAARECLAVLLRCEDYLHSEILMDCSRRLSAAQVLAMNHLERSREAMLGLGRADRSVAESLRARHRMLQGALRLISLLAEEWDTAARHRPWDQGCAALAGRLPGDPVLREAPWPDAEAGPRFFLYQSVTPQGPLPTWRLESRPLGEAGARPREQARFAGFTSDALSGFDPDDWFQRQMDGGLVTEGQEPAQASGTAAFVRKAAAALRSEILVELLRIEGRSPPSAAPEIKGEAAPQPADVHLGPPAQPAQEPKTTGAEPAKRTKREENAARRAELELKERARMAEKAAEKEARRLDHEHRLAQDKLRTAAKALRREAERKKQAEAQVILDQQRAEAELKREAARAAKASRVQAEHAAKAEAEKRNRAEAERKDQELLAAFKRGVTEANARRARAEAEERAEMARQAAGKQAARLAEEKASLAKERAEADRRRETELAAEADAQKRDLEAAERRDQALQAAFRRGLAEKARRAMEAAEAATWAWRPEAAHERENRLWGLPSTGPGSPESKTPMPGPVTPGPASDGFHGDPRLAPPSSHRPTGPERHDVLDDLYAGLERATAERILQRIHEDYAGGKLLSEQERFAVIRRALQAILRSEAFRYVPEAK